MAGKQRQSKKVTRELRAAAQALGAARRKQRAKKASSNVSYTRPWRQGVAAYPTRTHGGTVARGSAKEYFNANCVKHLSLPRAIGPYTVVRTTQLVSITSRVAIFGPMQIANSGSPEEMQWLNGCAVHDVAAGTAINGASNAELHTFSTMTNASWENAQVTPAAFTVQIMNPTAVSAATGVARIGRLRFMPDLSGDTRTWDDFADQATAYNFPRLCSGGKLALRGVKVDAVPFDMATLANFTPCYFGTGGVFTFSDSRRFAGFAPIIVCQDTAMANAGGLEVLVTCEWRVRFDPNNPAQATHQYWPVSSDTTWGTCQREMEALGHGVEDIAEDVAELGAMAYGYRRVAAVMAAA